MDTVHAFVLPLFTIRRFLCDWHRSLFAGKMQCMLAAGYLTGCFLLQISNILYAEIRNPADLQIPFEDGVLTFHWGWCFYLCLVVGKNTQCIQKNTFLCILGIICVLLGLAVSLLFQFYPEEMLSLFGNDVNQNKEQRYRESNYIKNRFFSLEVIKIYITVA